MTDMPQSRTARPKPLVSTAETVPSVFALRGHPIHPMLIPFPIAFLVGALVTDVAALATADAFFARMSAWLLGAGLVTGALAAVPGLIDLLTSERARRSLAGQIHAWGNGAVLGLSAVNLAVRVVGDLEAAVAPWGVALSAVVALLLVVTGWVGGELAYRHLIGVDPLPEHTTERRTAGE
jgi:uncharacterized membrane protein